MGHKKHHLPVDHAHGLPAAFTVFDMTLLGQLKRIRERTNCRLKAHTVFDKIRFSLLLVPFELRVYDKYVTTRLLLGQLSAGSAALGVL